MKYPVLGAVLAALLVTLLPATPQTWAASAARDARAAAQPRTAGSLAGPVGRVAVSSTFEISGQLRSRPRQHVVLQRKAHRAWRDVRTTRSDIFGSFRFEIAASSHAGVTTYRALVQGTGGGGGQVTPAVKVKVIVPGTWRSLALADHHSCGIKPDHSGWCWGKNDFGQVGIGATGVVRSPRRLPFSWRQIEPSGRATCGIRLDQTGWCWGAHPGNGTTDSTVPVKLPGLWRSLTPTSWYEDMAGWVTYVCGIRTDNSGWCWGDNWSGVLGIGESPSQQTLLLTPRQVTGQWREITSGHLTQCGIRTDDSGWCWGANYHGGLGDGTTENRGAPTQVAGSWSSLTPSANYRTCGIQTDASGWCWGNNAWGSVGDGTKGDRTSPFRLPGSWRHIDNRLPTVCGIQADDSGWCWGWNASGTVGDGTKEDRTTPYQLAGSWQSLVVDVATCGVQTNGSGWCWGTNSYGGLGDGTRKNRTTPQRLPHTWRSLQPGYTTCGQGQDSSLWCWGFNRAGEVGDGSTDDRLRPYRLAGRWTSLVADAARCGLRTNGWAYCWGGNRRGQTGAGVKGLVTSPVPLP